MCCVSLPSFLPGALPPDMPRRAPALTFWAMVAIVYGLVLLYTGGLTFPLERDELHFWPTSVMFGRDPITALTHYEELSTPLPFIVFGLMSRAGMHGVVLARSFNLALSAGVVILIGYAPGRVTWRSTAAAAGLLSGLYFVWLAAHVYTDLLAVTFVVLGTSFHRGRRYSWAAVCWLLAIASRQTMVAFPIAIAMWELRPIPDPRVEAKRWIWPLLGAASFVGWVLFFGGLFPPSGAGRISEEIHGRIFVDHGLYFLATAGAYYCLPELVLLRSSVPRNSWTRISIVAVLLVVAFVLASPVENIPAYQMGLLDRATHLTLDNLAAGGALRQLTFWLLACWASLRLSGDGLTRWLLIGNAVTAAGYPVAWDKYVVPLASVLWLLQASQEQTADRA